MQTPDPDKTFDEPVASSHELRIAREGMLIADRYILKKCLGEGGMGQAWLAEHEIQQTSDTDLPKFVLKIIPRDVQNDSAEMKKVQNSYRQTLLLKHTNICALHPLERDSRFGYVLVMEYIPGITLREHLLSHQNKKLSLEETLPILRQIADALDFAHSEKIIHRDIKPNNVMIMPNGKIQVIDFGLAAQVRTSMTQVSKVRMDKSGTPHYKAPEQWMGEYQDAKTDQYALGVLAYELLTGKLPFDGADEMEIGFQAINKTIPFIDTQPRYVNAAIAKAMGKSRKERFVNCREFVETLASEKTERKRQESKTTTEKAERELQNERTTAKKAKQELRKARVAAKQARRELREVRIAAKRAKWESIKEKNITIEGEPINNPKRVGCIGAIVLSICSLWSGGVGAAWASESGGGTGGVVGFLVGLTVPFIIIRMMGYGILTKVGKPTNNPPHQYKQIGCIGCLGVFLVLLFLFWLGAMVQK